MRGAEQQWYILGMDFDRDLTTAEELQAAAKNWTEALLPDWEGKSVLLKLYGDLGAGKTVFVKGVAEALGFEAEDIHSPSYVYQREHESDNWKLIHVDLWRAEDPQIITDLKLQVCLKPGTVLAVEWAERVPEQKKLCGDLTYEIFISQEGEARQVEVKSDQPQELTFAEAA